MNLDQRPLRVYADTSVFGGVADPEFEWRSLAFFEEVRAGRFILVIPSLVEKEIDLAPEKAQKLLAEFDKRVERIRSTDEAVHLRRAYVEAGFVRKKSLDDALHVAMASVHHCPLLVSWNFRDIVNFRKIPLYNEVNAANGYGSIAIYSPLEVIEDEP